MLQFNFVIKYVIEKDSAERVKRETLTQEIIRIQRNTSESLREEKRVEHLSRFACKLKNSGYDKRERKEIILARMKGFKRLEELEKRGVRSINRGRRENYNLRQLKKHKAKTGWYKKAEGKEKLGEKKTGAEHGKRRE